MRQVWSETEQSPHMLCEDTGMDGGLPGLGTESAVTPDLGNLPSQRAELLHTLMIILRSEISTPHEIEERQGGTVV